MPSPRPVRVALACVLLLYVGCRSPQADAYLAEQMRQLGDELTAQRQDVAVMRDQIDSLRTLVAKQDTLLRTLAGMANVPVPPR